MGWGKASNTLELAGAMEEVVLPGARVDATIGIGHLSSAMLAALGPRAWWEGGQRNEPQINGESMAMFSASRRPPTFVAGPVCAREGAAAVLQVVLEATRNCHIMRWARGGGGVT